ncbi:hypothetical protein ACFL0F_01825 [Patescibacteria group bacterium]
MAKPKEKKKARALRRGGESIKVIAKEIGISPGTASLWCRDIVLTPKQIRELERRAKDPFYGRRLEYVKEQQRIKNNKIIALKEQGIKEVGTLSKREMFLVGIALYWAEGFKKDSQAGFASSDPEMIRIFIKWLKDNLGYSIGDLSLRVTLNISHKHRTKEIQNYWSDVAGIPLKSFQKSYYQKVKWKKEYEKPNEYFGVLRVRIRKSTDLLRLIKGWIEGLKQQS